MDFGSEVGVIQNKKAMWLSDCWVLAPPKCVQYVTLGRGSCWKLHDARLRRMAFEGKWGYFA